MDGTREFCEAVEGELGSRWRNTTSALIPPKRRHYEFDKFFFNYNIFYLRIFYSKSYIATSSFPPSHMTSIESAR